jgi:branched-chain amino acid transport system permease protein
LPTTKIVRAALLAGLVACSLLAFTAQPAAAQPTAPTTAPATAPTTAPTPTSTPPASSGPTVAGTLTAGGKPVEGVTVTIRRGDTDIGEATSDDAGEWAIPVPGPGVYRVELDDSTLPEGITLRDPNGGVRPNFTVFGGLAQQRVLFPLVTEGEKQASAPSRFNRLANLFVSGVRFGLIVGLCSVGLSLIYGTTGLVNFAHGELVTFGALIAWFFSTSTGGPQWPLLLAAVISVIASGMLGGSLDLGVFQPMVHRRTGAGARMLVSIGLALLLRYLYQVIFGGNPRAYLQFSAQSATKVGPLEFPVRDYVIMAVCAVLLVLVGLALERTRLGTAVRAVSDERDLAESSGIDVRRVVLSVWVAGAALAGLGGIMLGVSQNVQWNMGFRLLLTMFAAVVLGGLGNAYGAMIGGLVVGIASEMSTYWIDADFKVAVALVILILVLLVRPQGILGVRERVG